jgi:hypothetical protein
MNDMRNDIRKYRVQSDFQADNFDLHVISLAGPKPWTALEIDGQRCTLSDAQALDLMSVLSRRLLRRKGFQATESGQCLTCTPDGSLEVEIEAEPEQLM